MMSEIEKLMQNAGVEKEWRPLPYGGIDESYPEFTAEKQLEITKFLLKKAVYYDVKDDKYWFYLEECESAGYKPYDEAIAHFINRLWQDLLDTERAELKRILE